MKTPARGPAPRLLTALLGVVLVGGACAYTVPLEPVSSVARSTFVYDAEGTLITTLHAEEDREPIELGEVAEPLRDAVIAIEDERFYAHAGVDVRATLRALFRNIEEGSVEEGGSTITQQYVKNVLIGRERTVGRKIKEASLAYQLERNIDKDAILERYLNTVYFGNGAYGAQAAAKRFFGKKADELTLAESSLLAGMIRAPERYDPYETPDVAEARRLLVLRRMRKLGMITDAELAAAVDAELEFIQPDERHRAGHYVKAVQRFIESNEDFGETRQERRDLLFKGGLRIFTNLDPDMQDAAQAAVSEVLADEDNIIAAFVAIEPETGKVKALWGGYDLFQDDPNAKFDFATKGRRQAGSSFKPFALVAALNEGIGPTQVYPAPSSMTLKLDDGSPDWKVSNYGGGGYGALTLQDATVRSVNTVYAQLILDVGPEKAVDLASEMGIESPLRPFPSAVLGTNEVSPLDMATAYGTLAADGVRTDPSFVDKVTDSDGRTLFENEARRRRVLSKMVARNATKILQLVPARGTALAARLSDGRDQAGKTGTAQQWRDAWYAGYTPDLVAVVWVGNPDKPVSMAPPLTKRRVTGGSYPAQIWKAFMEAALAKIPARDFPEAPPFKATRKIKTSIPCDLLYEEVVDEETGEVTLEQRRLDPEQLEEKGYSGYVISAAESTCAATTTTSTTTTTVPPTTTTKPPPPTAPPTTEPPPTTTTKAPTTTTVPPTTAPTTTTTSTSTTTTTTTAPP